MIRFFRLGERLFRWPHLALFVSQIRGMIQQNMDSAIRLLRTATWHVVAVWYLVAPLCAAVVYAVLAPARHRAARRKIARVAEAS